jgi:hypothetical protein
MNITSILHNPRSEGFFSFLVGVGVIVMLFHRPIRMERTLALDASEFDNKTIRAEGSCYTYRVEDASCEIASSK